MMVLGNLVSKLFTFKILLCKNGYWHIHKVSIVGVPALKVRHVTRDANEVSCFNHQIGLCIHDRAKGHIRFDFRADSFHLHSDSNEFFRMNSVALVNVTKAVVLA